MYFWRAIFRPQARGREGAADGGAGGDRYRHTLTHK